MQTNIEQVTSMIRALPLEDLSKVREILDKEENNKREKKAKSDWRLERYKKARKWLDENSQEYLGKWVCLEGDELIANGADALEVHRIAIEQGIKSPFLHHIVEEPELYMGGW